mmetsp:Transcript_40746/g.39344  ORF Transcript_40746/g.39344 Transcript_40746/m.39344 type:complete len:268 (-) Transcript_40746:435-1238(-)|eukprot:CAMPEP_0170565458 /NCGR_PEP_ID=MMETSP0211-20121228/79084_1 /TAXON_ID=311385 /ORGANISM="Pseudokeronopsis sp., Strain OXSARD2" /LENGTH=267 /DNA_ID=CAMNT_0010886327 /DNA_START=147 /DNA_END=950 /DNA_ORIENTATION=-
MISVRVPSIHCHIIKGEISARIGLIASDDSWRQDASLKVHIPQSDVLDGDSWLSLAFSEGIQHAPWPRAVWLLLLLGTNVDSPPDGIVAFKVLIEDVGNDSFPILSGVRLHIDGFDWQDHLDISEGDIFNAGVARSRRDTSNRHPQAEVHKRVFHQDVLSARSNLVGIVCRFHSHSIIKVSDGNISDENVGALRINPISVEREGWDTKVKVPEAVLYGELFLLKDINEDLHVLNQNAIHIIEQDMLVWRVHPSGLFNQDVPHSCHPE